MPYNKSAAAASNQCLLSFLWIHYLKLFIEQQMHHQLSNADNLSGQTENSKQVVENHDLKVGQHRVACVPRSAACHLKKGEKRNEVMRGKETGSDF